MINPIAGSSVSCIDLRLPFHDAAATNIYPHSLHDALPICDHDLYPIPDDAPIEGGPGADGDRHILVIDRDNWRLYELYRSEEHTSELQSRLQLVCRLLLEKKNASASSLLPTPEPLLARQSC